MTPTQQTAVLDRILDPVGQCMTPETARQLVSLRADPAAQARIAELADKNTEGLLSDDERAEYETYVAANNFIAIFQSKARAILAKNGAA